MTGEKTDDNPPPSSDNWHALEADEVLGRLASSSEGLSQAEAEQRLQRYGPNRLRPAKRQIGRASCRERV